MLQSLRVPERPQRLFFSQLIDFFFDGIDSWVHVIGQGAVSSEVSSLVASETTSILAESLVFFVGEFTNCI